MAKFIKIQDDTKFVRYINPDHIISFDYSKVDDKTRIYTRGGYAWIEIDGDITEMLVTSWCR